MPIVNALIILCFLLLPLQGAVMAKQQENIERYYIELAKPSQNYQPVLTTEGKMDNDAIQLTRYQPEGSHAQVHLGQAHISIVVNQQGVLKGLTRMDPTLQSTQQLDKKQVETIACDFLTHYAPDLLSNLTIQFIDPHSETLSMPNGTVTLTGMKMKCRDSKTGLYFWIIVAGNGSVMTFERDIYWDFIRFGRRTEQWLHDSWLKKQI